jgi:hypothetical protein
MTGGYQGVYTDSNTRGKHGPSQYTPLAIHQLAHCKPSEAHVAQSVPRAVQKHRSRGTKAHLLTHGVSTSGKHILALVTLEVNVHILCQIRAKSGSVKLTVHLQRIYYIRMSHKVTYFFRGGRGEKWGVRALAAP